MAEEPEQVLPEDHAAVGRVEHVRAEQPVGQHAEQAGGQDRERDQDEQRRDEDAQQKIGIRNFVRPGARMQAIVVTKFTAPRIVPSPETIRPTAHRLPPGPGEYVVLCSDV